MQILEQHTQKFDARELILKSADRAINDQIDERFGGILGFLIGGRVTRYAQDLARNILTPIADRLLFQKVIVHRVLYESVDSTGGGESTLSGLLIIPDAPAGLPRMPIMGLQHGTQLDRAGAPSQFDANAPFKTPEALIGIILACLNGYVVAMADYQGLGEDTKNIQPYVSAEPLAQSVVDMLKNTKEYINSLPHNRWNQQIYLTGYSQGGYVTMATARKIEADPELLKELPVKAVAPCAGPYSLSDAMRFLMLREEVFDVGGYFILMAIRGFNATYGDDFGDGIFTKEGSLNPDYFVLWDLADGNHTPDEVMEKMPPIPRHCLSDRLLAELTDPDSPAFKGLVQNDLVQWTPNQPLQLYHSPSDDLVPYRNSVIAHDKISEAVPSVALSPCFYIPLGTVVHVEAAVPCLLTAYAWLNTFRNKNVQELLPGEFSLGGENLFTKDMKYCLRYQLDGNVCYYRMDDISVQWKADVKQTDADPGFFIMQPEDGNLVVYDAKIDPTWASGTFGNPMASLVITDDHSLEIVSQEGKVIKKLA